MSLRLMLIVLLLPGCLTAPDGAAEPVRIVGDQVECSGPDCPTVERAEGAIVVHMVPGRAVSANNLTVSLVLSGTVVAPEGVRITGSLCEDCTVRLDALSVDSEGHGILAKLSGGAIVLRDVHVVTAGGGDVSITQESEGPMGGQIWFSNGGTRGIEIEAEQSAIDLEGVTVTARQTSALPALRIATDDTAVVSMGDVALDSHDLGMLLTGMEKVNLTDTRIACERMGIFTVGAIDRGVLDNVTVSGCSSLAIDAGFVDFDASRLRLRENHIALRTSSGIRFSLAHFLIEDNDYGLLADGLHQSTGTASQGTLRNNRELGMYVDWTDITVNDVAFLENGQAPAIGSAPEYLTGGIRVAARADGPTIDLRSNTFVGNQPVAIGYQGLVTIDASDSWWGLPTGPVPSTQGVNAGSGAQTYEGPVVTAPHRTAP